MNFTYLGITVCVVCRGCRESGRTGPSTGPGISGGGGGGGSGGGGSCGGGSYNWYSWCSICRWYNGCVVCRWYGYCRRRIMVHFRFLGHSRIQTHEYTVVKWNKRLVISHTTVVFLWSTTIYWQWKYTHESIFKCMASLIVWKCMKESGDNIVGTIVRKMKKCIRTSKCYCLGSQQT